MAKNIVEKKFKDVYEFLEKTQDIEPIQIGKQIFGLSEGDIANILSPKKDDADQQEQSKEQSDPIATREFSSSLMLPGAVKKEQDDATEYFTTNNEANHLAVITHIQELTKQKQITYVDTGNGTYEVNFNLPGCSMKRYMPEDETIGDSTDNYTLRDDSNLTKNETTKAKLQSDKGKKYLKEKEQKEHKRLMSKAEILKLGEALYPKSSEEEQILAIMQATGFYGWMRLSDTTSNYQLAVSCYRKSGDRGFDKMHSDSSNCGLVYTAAV